MESFVIRIYRREGPETIIGTVERVGKRRAEAFHNMHELTSILSSTRARRARSKKAPAPFAAIDDKAETS